MSESIADAIDDIEDGNQQETDHEPDPNKVDTSRKTKGFESTIKDKILVESSHKNLSEFYEHPLNYNQSESLAHIIKGLEGVLGHLNYWFVDVGIGLWKEFSKYRNSQGEKIPSERQIEGIENNETE